MSEGKSTSSAPADPLKHLRVAPSDDLLAGVDRIFGGRRMASVK